MVDGLWCAMSTIKIIWYSFLTWDKFTPISYILTIHFDTYSTVTESMIFISARKCNSSYCKQFCAFWIHSLFTSSSSSSSSSRMLSVRSSSVRGLLLYRVLPLVLLQLSCWPKLETVKREGCKDGCFWTSVPSGTFAKAVCSRLSQGQHGVRCQVKPRGCDCPSQLRIIPFSNFQTLKTI